MKKLTKIAAAAAALCLGAALLAGCSGSNDAASNAADNGAAANPDATTLIVGLDNAYPPYGFIGDDGNLTAPGAADAAASDPPRADAPPAAKPDMFVKLEPLSTENYAVGFAKDGDTAMIDAVNKTLKEMYDDGTIAKLCEKWGEYGISIDNWVLVD